MIDTSAMARRDTLLGAIVRDGAALARVSRLPVVTGCLAAAVIGVVLALVTDPAVVAVTGESRLSESILGSFVAIGALVALGFLAAPVGGAAAITYSLTASAGADAAGRTPGAFNASCQVLALLVLVVAAPLAVRAVALQFAASRRTAKPAVRVLVTAGLGVLAVTGWADALPTILRSAFVGPGEYDAELYLRASGAEWLALVVLLSVVGRAALDRRAGIAVDPDPVVWSTGAIVAVAAGGALALTSLLSGLLTWPQVGVVVVLLTATRLIRQGALPTVLGRYLSRIRGWDVLVYLGLIVVGVLAGMQVADDGSVGSLRALGWFTTALAIFLVLIAQPEGSAGDGRVDQPQHA